MTDSIATPDPWSWHAESPGTAGWERTARPDAPNKYFIVSADCHANEPASLWHQRMDEAYRDRLPRVEKDSVGATFQITEGFRPLRLRDVKYEDEDGEINAAGKTPEARLQPVPKTIVRPASFWSCGLATLPITQGETR